jgi:hypothetical protein
VDGEGGGTCGHHAVSSEDQGRWGRYRMLSSHVKIGEAAM